MIPIELVPSHVVVRGGVIPFADELEIGIYWSEAEGKITINKVVRGGGRFDPS